MPRLLGHEGIIESCSSQSLHCIWLSVYYPAAAAAAVAAAAAAVAAAAAAAATTTTHNLQAYWPAIARMHCTQGMVFVLHLLFTVSCASMKSRSLLVCNERV